MDNVEKIYRAHLEGKLIFKTRDLLRHNRLRVLEAQKYGLKAARRAPQFSKR